MTARILVLALLWAAAAGCRQQCFITECDYDHYREILPSHIEFDPEAGHKPASVVHTAAPMTVLDPDRPIRYLSLAEAVSIALEHGTVGNPGGTGTGSDTLVSFQGRGIGPSDHIRVLALDPAIVHSGLEASLSRFDAVWTTSMTWNVTDRPVGSALDAFQAGRTRNSIQTDAAQFSSSVVKPLPTGGVAGITFRTDYQFTNLPAAVNPAYTPSFQLGFEQPLLQGFGVDIQQLRAAHPGSLLFAGAFNVQPGSEGILISRIRYDQSRAEFERQVANMLLNVEVAYWNLYGSYWTLYSREAGLRQAFQAWRITKAKLDVGKATTGDEAQARGQYELFRGQRLTALGQVLENERQLRKLLGLVGEDGCRLVPLDTPTLSPFQPDWCTALNEALALRPELVLAREDLKFRQLDLIAQRNQLLPDLRFTSTYDVNSIGNRLDGPTANNAFRALSDGQFNTWSMGLRLNVPLGFRAAHANVRIARLELARSYAVLQDQEIKTQQFLMLQYRRLFEFYEQIRAQRAQREAFREQLRNRYEQFLVGTAGSTLDIVLEAQRFYADALANEFNAIVQYNNTLANFEFAKGTMLQHNNVHIAEGPLPCCAQVRAVEHHERRSKALILRERENPVQHRELAGCEGSGVALPELPQNHAPSLPALMSGAPQTKVDEAAIKAASAPKSLPSMPATAPVARPAPPARPTMPTRPAASTGTPYPVLPSTGPALN